MKASAAHNMRDDELVERLRQAREEQFALRLQHATGELENTSRIGEALEEAFRKLVRTEAPSLVERNRLHHRHLVDGVPIEYRKPDGSIGGALARVIDHDRPEANDWLAVHQ